ncbi:hypothetical protein [Synechococcus sp. LTW-R]|uniref:hypothetical protein n=1 Tax=Synechococcus sp. LTW-R TaxID=2751170 RepID=UPI00162595C8|nr:hypothetical protein [Synechococcus sp. LTW-R]QNG29594.1 hypothetical protein H0O22_13030 [Synechococcus sp. LTW-R]
MTLNGIAVGNSAQATDENATAIGALSSATTNAVAAGVSATATGAQAVAVGDDSVATTQSIATGASARANGATTVAVGYDANAVTLTASPVGKQRKADGETRLAIAPPVQCHHQRSGSWCERLSNRCISGCGW